MFGKTISLSKFPVTGSRCEDQTPLHFYVQMFNNKMLKRHETVCKYHLKQITTTREEMLQPIKTTF